MREIPLTRGKVALVDDADYDRVIAAGPWRAIQPHSRRRLPRPIYYTARDVGGRAARRTIYMHTFLFGYALTDHVDHNGLNNQSANCRPATPGQNVHNLRLSRNNTSGYKGVSWYPKTGKWAASIRVEGRRIHLGYHEDARDAAMAYDAAAHEHFGEYAYTNEDIYGSLGEAS